MSWFSLAWHGLHSDLEQTFPVHDLKRASPHLMGINMCHINDGLLWKYSFG